MGGSACARSKRRNPDLSRNLRGLRRRWRRLERAHIRRVRRARGRNTRHGRRRVLQATRRARPAGGPAGQGTSPELEAAPDAELDELTQLYVSRGLSPGLARQVAIELTAHDALAAHAEAEYGITPASQLAPLRDALAVSAAFAAGAIIPWLAMVLIPGPSRAPVTFVIVVLALALTGWVSARIVGRALGASGSTHGGCRRRGDGDHLHRGPRASTRDNPGCRPIRPRSRSRPAPGRRGRARSPARAARRCRTPWRKSIADASNTTGSRLRWPTGEIPGHVPGGPLGRRHVGHRRLLAAAAAASALRSSWPSTGTTAVTSEPSTSAISVLNTRPAGRRAPRWLRRRRTRAAGRGRTRAGERDLGPLERDRRRGPVSRHDRPPYARAGPAKTIRRAVWCVRIVGICA